MGKYERFYKLCDKIGLYLLYVLMADVCIFGAGKVISVGPVSFRMLLLGAVLLVSIPVMWMNRKYLFLSKYTWVVGGFCLWLIVSFFIALSNGNDMRLIVTDLKGFLYFSLFPAALCLLRSRRRARSLAKVVMYAAAAMALLHIAILLAYIRWPEEMMAYAQRAYEIHFFYFAYVISEWNVRISFLSLACQLFGCAFSVYFQVTEQGKYKWRYPLITALCLFAIVLSYTRSIYLAAFLAAVLCIAVMLIRATKKARKRLFVHLAATAALLLAIVFGFQMCTGVNYLGYGISRAFVGIDLSGGAVEGGAFPEDPLEGDGETQDNETDGLQSSTVASDQLRDATVADLWSNIKQAPMFGLGLGATIPSRPDGLNEYFFLDLWSKTGVVGLALYLAPMAFMAWELFKKLRQKDDGFYFLGMWFAVMVGFVIYSYFTPCMNSSVGILCYCCAMAVFRQENIMQLRNKGE